MLIPIVSFPPMKHLNHRNETIFLRNETVCLNYFLYICDVKGHSACGDKGLSSEGTALHAGVIADADGIGNASSMGLRKC